MGSSEPQLSIISDSSCSRSSSPRPGSMSSPRWSSVNSFINSSKSSTAEELETVETRDATQLGRRGFTWGAAFITGLGERGQEVRTQGEEGHRVRTRGEDTG